MTQTAIAFENLAALAADWFRANSGEFVASVRLEKCPVRNTGSTQMVKAPEQAAFGRNAAYDYMGMR
jgi:hypothetical protein